MSMAQNYGPPFLMDFIRKYKGEGRKNIWSDKALQRAGSSDPAVTTHFLSVHEKLNKFLDQNFLKMELRVRACYTWEHVNILEEQFSSQRGEPGHSELRLN